ncbi:MULTISPECIES: acyltransferase family protein [unclassified Ruegeria]|uniref:acyltransferase family protein n=1 Tax=unclassified Ruegeria TaxID=2625375 RepID=UPI0014912310|nr:MULTISPECIES: acyltransferase family protein [unclassified Ruegeria]NOD49755.1 acyltransferase family protein [Ruegeria sp. HKCCD5849]NOD54143.1 acyltransferase family protein [Ruegeria sp. HKCCD5851]NOD70086.1 acyltransferase family protein [Ruegeria sp. HKCCD7303]
MKYRPDIDGLRTVAVCSVMLFHTGLGFPGGFVGVDIFFVISGFLITTILWTDLQTGRFSIMNFYERRVRRILPALFVVMLASTVLAVLLFLPDHLADFGKSMFAANIFLSNLYFYFETDYFTEAAHLKPMLHTWSLAVEEQYYILFPPILALLFKMFRPSAVLGWLVAAAAVSLIVSVWMVQRNPPGAFYLPQARAWELLLGAMTAICVAQGWGKVIETRPNLTFWLVLLAMALIIWPVATYGPETVFPGFSAVPPCLGTAILILTGAYRKTVATRLLSVPPMVFIGKISYSLYLWHWPVLVFAIYVSVDPLTFSELIGCILLSFLLATLSWRYVEAPFRKSPGFGRQQIFTFGSVSAVLIAGIGGGLVITGGLPARMPSDITRLLQEDRFLHDQRNCHFITPERARAGDICLRGTPGVAPSFVLVGDSHADAFSPAIFAAAQSVGLSGYQYTQAGFRPLPQIQKKGDPSYAAQTEAFMSFLADRPEIDTVIITAFWEHQITGATYRHSGDIWFDAGQTDWNGQTNREALLTGIGRLAEAFPKRQFILLDDVPSSDDLDLKTHLRSLLFQARDQHEEIGMHAESYADQRAIYEPLLVEVAETHPNVVYRAFFLSLCDTDICPLFKDNEPVFRNGDHLSVQGAHLLRPEAKVLLQDIFGLPPTADM